MQALLCIACIQDMRLRSGQVKAFWSLMSVGGLEKKPSKLQMHADAWGIRKLISHALRTLRLARAPRVL